MSDEISFGRWLRDQRKALDLTQEALGERVGYAAETIRRVESGRRRPSRELATRLAEQLGVSLPLRDAVVEYARGQAALPVAAVASSFPTAPRSPLPTPLTPLVGREREFAAVLALLRQPSVRLVTLTGVGGVGKTRLSLELATTLLDDFADGVYVVELAPLTEAALVLPTIAHTLGIVGVPTQSLFTMLQAYLRARQLLLVLDNLEHVADAATQICELLHGARRLTVLGTSRTPLHVDGEQVYPVPPLELPAGNGSLSLDALLTCAAVQLFVVRAQAVRHDFVLTEANARAVWDVCRRVDALPLGIELAAAWSHVLSCEQVAAEVRRSLDFLSSSSRTRPPRHQSLRAVFDSTWRQLSSAEQRALRTCSLFRGGFAREAAAEVAGAALGVLASLVDRSLLRRTAEDRFELHDVIRQYAVEHLGAGAERNGACAAHLAHYLALAEAAEPRLMSREHAAALAQLDQEHDNLRTALAWSVEAPEGQAQGLRLAAALFRFWYFRGLFAEGRRWLDRLLQVGDGATPRVRANALAALAGIAWLQGDFVAAGAAAQESLCLFRHIGDRGGTALALMWLGIVRWWQQGWEYGRPCFEESISLYRASGDSWGLATTLRWLGEPSAAVLSAAEKQAHLLESKQLFERLGDRWGLATVLEALGHLSRSAGAYDRARALYEEALRLRRFLGDRWFVAWSLAHLGDLDFEAGQYAAAREAYLASLEYFRDLGTRHAVVGQHLARLGRIALEQGDTAGAVARFRAAVRESRSAVNRDAVAYSLIGLAALALIEHQARRAACLLGAASAATTAQSGHGLPVEHPWYDDVVAQTRAALDKATFMWAWSIGQQATEQQVYASVVEGIPLEPGDAPAPRPPGADTLSAAPISQHAGLSAREVEILGLVTRGLSYRAIGVHLGISRHTVNAHLRRIYGKLGVTSRSAATRVAVIEQLV